MDELPINILKRRAKLILMCIRYTEALTLRFSVHTEGSDVKFVDTKQVKALLLLLWLVAKLDSAYS
jgi:hypothetical protein